MYNVKFIMYNCRAEKGNLNVFAVRRYAIYISSPLRKAIIHYKLYIKTFPPPQGNYTLYIINYTLISHAPEPTTQF